MSNGALAMRSNPVLALGLGALLWAGPPVQAAERSVTIIEGAEEPPPNSASPRLEAAPLVPFKTRNPAGVALTILPDGSLPVGTKIAFSVSTQEAGYLVIVDVDAEGRWTQIYPNLLSLSRAVGTVATENLVKPDMPVTIPNSKSPLARFVFTADPPVGNGAIVAILSDQPVQTIGLPETPPTPLGLQAAIDALSQSIAGPKSASTTAGGPFSPGVWSFAAVPYVIQ